MNGPFIELKGGGTYRNLTSEVTCYPEGKVSRSIQLRTDDSGDSLTIVQYFFGGKSITLNPTEVAWLRDQLNAMPLNKAEAHEERGRSVDGDLEGHARFGPERGPADN